ncbi:DNA primase DnaG [Candidatus Syntrophocurvum alkaliphilum]|uniref:DNA primase DnaG n=2 Tax=Candidatus Syntrophocurvum alkaliphilum TaxID=2293317 RepID=A0A6I6D8U0_9FIRM|nr:DNA primase DnaG [Candidatus Syntrophocurvum alkaliphilum]
MISMITAKRLKEQANIVNFIIQHVELQRKGRNYQGLCPFHQESTPSFVVSPEKGRFKCFGCGATGDVYDFLMKYHNIDFKKALGIVAAGEGIRLEGVNKKDFQKIKEEAERRKLEKLKEQELQNRVDDWLNKLEIIEDVAYRVLRDIPLRKELDKNTIENIFNAIPRINEHFFNLQYGTNQQKIITLVELRWGGGILRGRTEEN